MFDEGSNVDAFRRHHGRTNNTTRSKPVAHILITNAMDHQDQDLRSRLIDLAARAEPRLSKADKFRRVFPEVEAALRRGVSRADILTELNRDGFDLTEKCFKSYLQRERETLRVQAQACKESEDVVTKEPDATSTNPSMSEFFIPLAEKPGR